MIGKALTACLLCFFGTLISELVSSAGAQPSFVWVQKGGGAGRDHGYSVATDGASNVIVTGLISTPSATFSGRTLVPTGPVSAFIAKYDSHGNLLFARLAGNMGYSEGVSVSLDPAGNILLAGVYTGYAVFGATTLNPGAGTGAAFIAKYDLNGTPLWATQVVSTHSNGPSVNGISSDSAGNILVAGSAWGNIIFGTQTLQGRGLNDAFVAKLSPSGQFLWAASGGTTGYDSASSVSADATGNVVVTGYYGAYGGAGMVATFGSASLTSVGGGDWFLAKYDANGSLKWATSAGGPGLDIPFSSRTDQSGNIYVGGQFSGNASFGKLHVTGAGSDHMVVVKYDGSGNSLWANAAIGTSRSRGLSVALDTHQNPYLAGEFQGSLDFGVNVLSSAGGFDAFIAKFSSQGAPVWAKRAGGAGDDSSYAVAIASDGSIFLTGGILAPADFDGVAVTPDKNGDTYVAKLQEPSGVAPSITTQPTNQNVTAGSAATFTAAASGTPTPALQWQVSTNAASTWTNLTNTAPYGGVTSTTLAVTATPVSFNGAQYRAVATNGVGTPATSSAAVLTVTGLATGPGARIPGLSLQWPIKGEVTITHGFAEFAALKDAGGNPIKKHHTGVDLRATDGITEVYAAAPGKVLRMDMDIIKGTLKGDNHCMGHVVLIDHSEVTQNGVPAWTLYAHLDTILVANGRRVDRGELIAIAGATPRKDRPGCVSPPAHLHFDLKELGVLGNDTDGGPLWGFTPATGSTATPPPETERPEAFKYHDPILNLFQLSTPSGSTAEVIAPSDGARMRPAPGVDFGIYRGPPIGVGTQLTVINQAPPSTRCSMGWYQVRRADGEYFGNYAANAYPMVWTCAGNGGQTWVRLTAGSAAPSITAEPMALQFAAIKNGTVLSNVTPEQAVSVTFIGPSSGWTATANQPWVQLTGAAGAAAGQFSAAIINPSNVIGSSTALSATITLTPTAASIAPVAIPVTLTVKSPAATLAPFGAFDTPATGATVAGSIAVTGWALDDVGIDRVELWRDLVAGETTAPYPGPGLGTGKVFIANAFFVGGARTDVEELYPTNPLAFRAGWGYLLLTQGLWSQGNGPFNLHAFAYDKEGQSASLGSKAITASNAAATKPFGGIDLPAYGQTVTSSFWNFGWALTPNATPPCSIGASGVQVRIDSRPLTAVSYGDLRPDIAAAFPGFSNGAGAGGAFHVDLSTLTNGTHQIGWFVTDNCGRAEGIGSRFFSVINGNVTVPTADAASPDKATTIASDVRIDREPVEVRRGGETTVVYPNPSGARVVAIGQSEHIEVQLPSVLGATYTGFQVVNDVRRSLPLGSSLDVPAGIFYWQPAAGFLGAHNLEFVPCTGVDAVRVRAVVGTSVQAVIDTPAPGPVGSSFTVAGWAIEEASTSGTGIDAVHVWAYPAAGGAPVFLGVAAYGDARPDIGGLFGDQFTGASYSLAVDNLAFGTYDVVVYPHSAVAGDFHGAKVVRVTVP